MTAMRIFRYISLLTCILLCGCAKELPDAPSPVVTDVIPFSVTVQSEPDTRASLNGASLGEGSYVFATGDKLYVIGGEGNVYGELSLNSGDGTGDATFSGSLSIINDYVPTAETVLSATLVGSQQSGFFTVSDQKITAGPTYPTEPIAYATPAELVQRYSHFTGSFTYNLRHVTLTQQTVFLNFELDLFRAALVGSPDNVRVDIKSADGNSVLRSVTNIPVSGSGAIARVLFTTVFPAGTELQGAQTWINNGNGIQCSPNFSNSLELLPNKYYRVIRSAVDDFTVEAPAGGLGANVTFNYAPVEYRTYHDGAWSDWGTYTSTISLSAGDKVSFRGQNTSYNNSGGSTPLITVSSSVLIYGDIMSLMCDANGDRLTSVGENAFKQAFKGCTRINIHPDKDLMLSAETLGASCYENMFYGCTALNKAPILPATTIPARAYYGMFENCSLLTTPPSLLATAIGQLAYSRMFYQSGITSLPSFPTTQVTWNGSQACYMMFQFCTHLETVTEPLFSGTLVLGQGCYQDMFAHCTSLTIPDNLLATFLPATTLARDCYRGMFQDTGLVKAPHLLVQTLTGATDCYRFMFNACDNLNYVKCLATDNSNGAFTSNWMNGTQQYGYVPNTNSCTFEKHPDASWPRNANGILSNWAVTNATL